MITVCCCKYLLCMHVDREGNDYECANDCHCTALFLDLLMVKRRQTEGNNTSAYQTVLESAWMPEKRSTEVAVSL